MTTKATIDFLLPFTLADRIEDFPDRSAVVDIVSCNTERVVIIARNLPRALAERILADINPLEMNEEDRVEQDRVKELKNAR